MSEHFSQWEIGKPHFMDKNSDYMGNPTPTYWRVFASHKTAVPLLAFLGCGDSAEAAVADARGQIEAKEKSWKEQI